MAPNATNADRVAHEPSVGSVASGSGLRLGARIDSEHVDGRDAGALSIHQPSSPRSVFAERAEVLRAVTAQKRACVENEAGVPATVTGQVVTEAEQDVEATERLRAYLRVRTAHPTPDYRGAVEFLTSAARDLGLPHEVVEPVEGFPIVLIKWQGQHPELKAVLLNSHIDVVTYDASRWTRDPFAAEMDDEGNIYGRGAQDMKSVGMMHLEAVHRLSQSGFKPLRTVYISFVPEEEMGGAKGMGAWIKTEHFLSLNIGCTIDEGIPTDTDTIHVFHGERKPLWVYLRARGIAQHASRLPGDTAPQRLLRALNKLLAVREREWKRLNNADDGSEAMSCSHCSCGGHKGPVRLGDVMSINVTALHAGVGREGRTMGLNIIPDEAQAGVDIRIPPNLSVDEVLGMLHECTADLDTDFEVITNPVDMALSNVVTPADDTLPWWKAVTSAFDKMKMPYEPDIFPVASDSRYLRDIGIHAFGISPLLRTENRMHGHDEYIHRDVFLQGIRTFATLIEHISELPPSERE